MESASSDPSVSSLQKDVSNTPSEFTQVMEDSKQENGKTEAVIDEKQSIPSTPALDALNHPAKEPPPIYSAFSPGRKRFILIVTTIAGFFGPFTGKFTCLLCLFFKRNSTFPLQQLMPLLLYSWQSSLLE